MKQSLAVELTESGYIPDSIIRHGIRKLLRQRLVNIETNNVEAMQNLQADFILHMNASEIALLPEKANEQHYEVPQSFYQHVLGPHANTVAVTGSMTPGSLQRPSRMAFGRPVNTPGSKTVCEFSNLDAAGVHSPCGWQPGIPIA